MTTPSATISITDVATEFGLPRNVSLSSFYGLGGAQSSGTISLSDMRNRSAALVLRSSVTGSTPITNGQIITVTDDAITITATSATTFNYTRSGAPAGNPATGSTAGTSVTFSVTGTGVANRTASWAVTAAGLSFTVRVTASGTQ